MSEFCLLFWFCYRHLWICVMYGNSVNFNVNGILLNIVYIAKPCELNLAAFRVVLACLCPILF